VTNVSAKIINIESFATHDGPGIRTVIFFKGCALRCLWCANPESQLFEPELLFLENACKNCGECILICPRGAISLIPEHGYITDSARCDFCLECVSGCMYNARLAMGETYDADALWEIIEKDRDYYLESGGGITFSGGEPLFYVDMIRELSARAARAGYTSLIETCGHIATDAFEEINGLVDWIYFDFKHADSATHAELTGQGNELILKNLDWVDRYFKGKYAVRYPYIPEMNDDDEALDAFFRAAVRLKNCQEVVLLPYHRLGETKYNGLGRVYEMGDQPSLTQSDLDEALQRGRSFGLNVRTE
jgi:pyruvate formate lyase activating enzyme